MSPDPLGTRAPGPVNVLPRAPMTALLPGEEPAAAEIGKWHLCVSFTDGDRSREPERRIT